MAKKKRRLFLGTVDTLFTDIENDLLDDGNDYILLEAAKNYEDKFKLSEEMNDGFDDLLNKSYDQVIDQLNPINAWNDDFDDLLNKSYDEVMKKVNRIPENIQRTFLKTKKEIKKDELLAKIYLIEKKRSWGIREEMSDCFYSLESWPIFALELLLTHDFGYSERIGLALFFFGNGLNDEVKALINIGITTVNGVYE